MLMQKESTLEFFKNFYQRFEGHPYGGYMSVWEPTFLVREPALIKQILIKDFSHFHDRGVVVDEKNDPLTAHLFNLSGQRWHFLRNKLSPTFTSGKMRYMFPLVKKCTEDFHKAITAEISKNGNEIEVKDMNARYTTDVIGTTAFGVDVGSLFKPDAEMRMIGRKIFELTTLEAFKMFVFFLAPGVAKYFKFRIVEPYVEKYFIKVVSDTIEYRQGKNITRNDFLQLLMNLKNSNATENGSKDELDINQLCAQAFVFFIGGFETSATTLTFCLYELARHPDIQKKMAEEIDQVLEKHNGELTYESLSEMPYMDRVISETLRLYPAVPILFRECTKEYRIKREEFPDPLMPTNRKEDIVIEKGVKVLLPIVGLHYDPKYYPHPEKFDPDRFTEEAKSQRPPFTFLPFGEGPRICIGMRFGNMQTKAGLVALLSNFEIRPGKKTANPIVLDPKLFVPAVKDGVYLQFIPRKKQN
ncbi:cytochrome P450 6a2-like [Hetaerina americana]|uniref:cytochrome P450 6a2-like n=1 Tax=Hetaerina americana TaxID=62018 RepID=UPI003A7F4F7E